MTLAEHSTLRTECGVRSAEGWRGEGRVRDRPEWYSPSTSQCDLRHLSLPPLNNNGTVHRDKCAHSFRSIRDPTGLMVEYHPHGEPPRGRSGSFATGWLPRGWDAQSRSVVGGGSSISQSTLSSSPLRRLSLASVDSWSAGILESWLFLDGTISPPSNVDPAHALPIASLQGTRTACLQLAFSSPPPGLL